MHRHRIAISVSCLALTATFSSLVCGFEGPPPPKDWALTLGFAPVYSPAFLGSSDYALSVFPDIRLNFQDKLFFSVRDGLGYNVINTPSWKVGPLVKIRFGRREEQGGSPFLIGEGSNGLKGLGDIDTSGEAGGFAQFTYAQIRSRVELRQSFGGYNSFVGDLNVNYFKRLGPLNFSIGPRLSFAGDDYVNTFFGINASQSQRSGLAQHQGEAGLVSYGIGGSAVMPITAKLAVTVFAGYDRLTSDIAQSPLIQERGDANQASVGLAFGYRTDWNN
jgi:outer membrane scaffolding protein for murein synthesis (MipA/OmpV family)